MDKHQDGRCTFLTSHARVLLVLARDQRALLSTIAADCQITERRVQVVLNDLEHAGFLQRRRAGRRSRYVLDLDRPLRHPAEASLTVRDLVVLTSSAYPMSAAADGENAADTVETGAADRPNSAV
ncbi:transcriptional regulator [Streptomyces sp. SID14478]|uniref:transcriptional regulator n=1 Tax=Streptomyces sp. SID14478 TaxID=2706073 RepID=UPI0019447AA5|nr:transcriptional regulator [Streptomyces sp. SID14478]